MLSMHASYTGSAVMEEEGGRGGGATGFLIVAKQAVEYPQVLASQQ